MGWNDITIDIQFRVGESSQVFQIRRVISGNQLPLLDFNPIDFPVGKEDDIFCTPEKNRKRILKFREQISKILAEEFMEYFGKDDTIGGHEK